MTARAPEHEIHRRRLGRNLGLGLALASCALLLFALTLVKLRETIPPSVRDAPAAASVQGVGE